MTRHLGDTKLAALRIYQEAKEAGATEYAAALIAAGHTGVRTPATILGWVSNPDLQAWEREARLVSDAAEARAFVLELLALDLSYACHRPACSNLIEWRADQPPPDQLYCCQACETEHHSAAAEQRRLGEWVDYYLRQCGYSHSPGRKIFGPELLEQLHEASRLLSLRSSLEEPPVKRRPRRSRLKAESNNSRARGDFSVACPTCEVPVGEKCKSSVQHAARVRARTEAQQ